MITGALAVAFIAGGWLVGDGLRYGSPLTLVMGVMTAITAGVAFIWGDRQHK